MVGWACIERKRSWAACLAATVAIGCGSGANNPPASSAAGPTGAPSAGVAAPSGGSSSTTQATTGSGGTTSAPATGTMPSAPSTGGQSAPVATGGTAAAPIAAASGTPGAVGGAPGQAPGGEVSGDTSKGPANAWLRMGYDHTNRYFNPVERTLSVTTAPMYKQKWVFEVSGFPPGSPVVVNGRVYALATGGMYAIDLETGKQVWSRTDIAGTSSVAYQDGAIYVHSNAKEGKLLGLLWKLSAADGKNMWGPIVTYDLENCDGTSSPMLGDGKVFVGHGCGVRELALDGTNKGPRGGVEAFAQDSGVRLWTYWSVPATGEDGAMSWSTQSIDFEEKVIYASTGNNYTVYGPGSDAIHKIDMMTGMGIWMTQVRKDDVWGLLTGNVKDTDFGANPILAEIDGQRIVAAGDKGSAFWAIDRTTGKILWGREMLTPSRSPSTGGSLNNGGSDNKHFYVAMNDANSSTSVLFKLDPKTGADVWTKKYNELVWGGLALANGVLVAAINDDVHLLNTETGDTLNTFNTGGTIAGGSPAIADGKIVVKSGLSYPLNGMAVNNNKIFCYALP